MIVRPAIGFGSYAQRVVADRHVGVCGQGDGQARRLDWRRESKFPRLRPGGGQV